MEVYLYTARELFTQKRVKGELSGESEVHIRKILIEKNLYPVSVKRKNILNSDIPLFQSRIKLTDINFFCKQFAAMIQADISVTKSLEICAKQTPNKTLSAHLRHLHEAVSEGKTFSHAIEEEKIFPNILVNLIICGEASGNLAEVVKRSVDHFDSQLGLRKKVRKALAYPTLVMIVVAVVIVILMIKVIPVYMGLLNDIGAEIPIPTQMIIQISNFFVNQGGILLDITVMLGMAIFNMKKIPSIRRVLDRLLLRLPVLGALNKKSLTATFSSTMSLLVESGIPMLTAIEITKKVMENAVAEEEMNRTIEKLKQGSSLLEAIGESKIFPELLLSMVSIGEESGTLDEMFVKMSDFYKEEVGSTVDNLAMLIEPIMIIIVAIMIGGVMAAIMLPTFSAATAAM